MRAFEHTTRIARRPATVHDFVQDFDRYPDWIPFTKQVLRVEGDGGPGTKYWERGTGGESSWEVLEVEPGKREVHEGDIGIARMRIEMAMEPDGSGKGAGTVFHHTIAYDMKVPVLGAILDKLVLSRSVRNGVVECGDNLKRILEAEA